METFFPCDTLVFDTSVLINLAETGHCPEIFDALDSKCLVTQQVLNEFSGKHQGYVSRQQVISKLINRKSLSVVHLDEDESAYFIGLISADDADALDDGEASTLALARSNNAVALIDEKKGIRIAAQSNPSIMTSSTVDLIYWISLNHSNKLPVGDIVVKALLQAKMRVPHEHEEWVLGLVPKDMLMKCTSLKKRLRANQSSVAADLMR